MKKSKILFVLGTRPEAIKLAPLVSAFKNIKSLDVFVCSTGQHKEMLKEVFEIFDFKPNFDLEIMKENQDLFDISSAILVKIKEIFKAIKPDFVVIHGDTTSSQIVSLASFYSKIPVIHIEAGLRTNDLTSPWPEEGNRQLISRLTELHYAPTLAAKNNLLKENVLDEKIFISGNTVVDALNFVNKVYLSDENKSNFIAAKIKDKGFDSARISSRKLILITGHRRENFGQGFEEICHAINVLSLNNPDVDFVYPVHLNPNVKGPVLELISNINRNVFLLEPLNYTSFLFLLKNCYLVLTDSGGIQEEAPSFGKPLLIMRDITERQEVVNSGSAILVGSDSIKIIRETQKLIDNKILHDKMSTSYNPFGDGKAAEKIVQHFLTFVSKL